MTESQLSKTKLIGFLGFGVSNRAVYDFLSSIGNFEYIIRERSPSKLPFTPKKKFYGDTILQEINEDMLFISPSYRREVRELEIAAARGTILSSDSELFFSLYPKEVYGVTGTGGKSTVTHLIADMLTIAGKITYPIGNFGTGFSNYIRSSATVVAELSSFQLTYLDPQLECAIITGIGEDHLNWHHSIREYRESKLKILNRAKKAVIDADCSAITNAIGSQKIFAAISQEKSFSELRRVINAENYMTYAENLILLNGEPFLDVSRAVRKEAYNLKNYMLAASAVLQNADRDAISYSVNKFVGLPHRCETVASIGGIRYINSSIDTSPERALTTLLSINGVKVPIFCGTGKGLSYKLLAKETTCGSVGAVLMGQVGEAMEKEIKRISPSFPLVYSQSMRDAVKSAAMMLGEKGAVILAPAGVSYDKYKSFEERGDDFRSAVLEGQR